MLILDMRTRLEMSSTAKADQANCEANDFEACNNLAVALFKGVGVTRDATEGVRLYNKACTGGNGLACSNLAGVYVGGDGVKQDYVGRRYSSSERAAI